MVEFTINSTQEDFIANFKKITEKIINKEKPAQTYSFDTIPTDETIKENLIFFLAGLSTPHIQYGSDGIQDMVVNPGYKNKNMLLSFEPLCLSLRNIKRFISQTKYLNDSIKSIISVYLIERIEIYHKKLLTLSKKEIEEILVELHGFGDEFTEYSLLIENIEVMGELEVLDYIFDRKERILEGYYEEVLGRIRLKVYCDISNWIHFGEISNCFFIFERKNEEFEFDECFWKIKYKLGGNIPYFVRNCAKKIFEAGLYINIFKRMNCNYKIDSIPSQISNSYINAYHSAIKLKFSEIIHPLLFTEIENIYNTYFIKDVSPLLDIFDQLGTKILHPIDNQLCKINSFWNPSNIKYKCAETRINHYICKILNVEKIHSNVKNNVLENLSVEYYKKNALTDIFFSKKLFFELEIIFRFLYSLFALQYIFIRLERNLFVTNSILFIENLRSSLFLNLINDFETGGESSAEDFENFVKNSLRRFYLTNVPVFTAISEILDLFYDYVYLKGPEELCLEKYMDLVAKFKDEIIKHGSDYSFINFLDKIKSKD